MTHKALTHLQTYAKAIYFFIQDLKLRLEVKKVEFVISDKLDGEGEVLIHSLPPG